MICPMTMTSEVSAMEVSLDKVPFKIEVPFKMKLFEDKELVVTDKALVIVTKDKDGKPIRWAIFGKEFEK